MKKMDANTSATTSFHIDHRKSISQYISTYIFLCYLIFGNLGNVLKIFFFLQKPLKRCPCTIYVLCATISHFFTLNNIPLSNFSSDDWIMISFGPSSPHFNGTMVGNSLIPSKYSINICKIRNYFHMWSSNFSLQLLVFASINRFFLTLTKKNRVHMQRLNDFFSSLSTAYLLCSITCCIWSLISLHHFFNITIKHNTCSPQNTFLWAMGLVSIHIFQLVSMVIFGTLTIFYRQERWVGNRRRCRNHHEMIPMFNQLCQYCRSERSERHHVENQLTSMIITEIILVIFTLLPYTIYILYRLITVQTAEHAWKSLDENLTERLIQLTFFFEPSCGFYIYLFSLKTLTRRFLHILRRRIGMED